MRPAYLCIPISLLVVVLVGLITPRFDDFYHSSAVATPGQADLVLCPGSTSHSDGNLADPIHVSLQKTEKAPPRTIAKLQEAIKLQEVRVEACRDELKRLIKNGGIIYRKEGEDSEPNEAERKHLEEAKNNYQAAKQQFENEAETLTHLRIKLLEAQARKANEKKK